MDENDRIAIAVLQANARNTDANLARLESKVDTGFAEIKADIKAGFSEMRAGFSEIRTEIKEVKDDSKRDLKWTMGLFVGGVLFILGAMATGFFWLAGRQDKPTAPMPPARAAATASPGPVRVP